MYLRPLGGTRTRGSVNRHLMYPCAEVYNTAHSGTDSNSLTESFDFKTLCGYWVFCETVFGCTRSNERVSILRSVSFVRSPWIATVRSIEGAASMTRDNGSWAARSSQLAA